MPAPDLTQEELHAWLQAFFTPGKHDLPENAPLLTPALAEALKNTRPLTGSADTSPPPLRAFPPPLLP